MHNLFAADQPTCNPQLVVQLVAYGNVLNIGYVESREQALDELYRLERSGRLDELAGSPDKDKFLILNAVPRLGMDRAQLDYDVEVLLCAVPTDAVDEHGDTQYQWVDTVDLLPEHIQALLRLP